MNTSLEKLANNLLSGGIHKLKHTFEYFKNDHNEEDLKFIIQKGVFPYEYLDSFKKLNEKHLPKIEDFYSSITEKNINDKDYDRKLESLEIIQV